MDWEDENIFDRLSEHLWEELLNETEQEISPWAEISTDEVRETAFDLKNKLLEQYKHKKLEQIFDLKQVRNEFGVCYEIQSSTEIELKLIPKHKAIEALSQDLKLVQGIWYAREQQLKQSGFKTVFDLKNHPVFGSNAVEVAKMLERFNPSEFLDFLYYRLGKWSSRQAFYCSAFFEPEHFLFFDLETLGLFHRIIILFGTAYFQDKKLIIKQYLVADYEQEPAALWEFVKAVQKSKALVSFNGRSFDYHFVQERLAYNSILADIDLPHFDLYHLSKQFYNNSLPNFKLKTLEKHIFGIEREDDVPSDLVPDFYQTYIQTGNIGPLVPIITHNQQDLITSAMLFANLQNLLQDD